jgi:hypothetical protein
MEIDMRINKLKQARVANATSIRDLEEKNEVIIIELEKILVKKGEIQAAERMREYFKDEQ